MNDLTTGNVTKLILRFAIPLMLAEVLQQLYYTIDSLVAGNFMGHEALTALAAMGSTLPVIMCTLAFAIGISIASEILTSQLVGAKMFDELKRTITTTIIAFSVVSIIISVASFFFCEPVLKLLNVPNDIMPQAKIYLQIMLAGLIFIAGYNETSAVFRGIGDSKTPLILVGIAVSLNLVLDLLFIIVFKTGIAGIAFATLISQGFAFFVALWILIYKQKLVPTSPSEWQFSFKILKKIGSLGLPIAAEMLLSTGGILIVVSLINGFGLKVIAATSIVQSLDDYALMPILAIAGTISTFVGQNIAAGKMDRVRSATKIGLIISIISSLIISGIVIVFGNVLASLFTRDLSVIHIACEYFIIVGSFYAINGIVQSFTGAVQGAGQTVVPMVISLVTLWIIRVPLAYFLSRKLGYEGIWWSQVATWSLCAITLIIYYFTGKWKYSLAINNI